MISREQDESFVMVKQHEHGRVAGEFALHFKEEQVPAGKRQEEVVWAISNHDRGWIDLDETPFWNDAVERTRTSTVLLPHGPEPCASANSATTANYVTVIQSP